MTRITSCFAALTTLVIASLIPALVWAQEVAESGAEKTARTGSGNAPDTVATLLSLGVGLLAVIAIIFGCAWLVKRMNGMAGGHSKAMKVVSVMPMGTRERIALIDVGGTHILIGVTPSAIRTLHVFDEPVALPEGASQGDFARKLQGLINRSTVSDLPQDKDS